MVLSVDLVETLHGRRSAPRLTEPVPSQDRLCDLVADAAEGPDHGSVRPWRLVLVSGESRSRLGAAFAERISPDDPQARARAAAKPLRAPLLVSIVFAPRELPSVPEWEQLAATACMVSNLMLLLHAQGWGSMWRTGLPCTSPDVRRLLGVGDDEQLLGWLYVGTPVPDSSQPPRPEHDWRKHVFSLGPDGIVSPL